MKMLAKNFNWAITIVFFLNPFFFTSCQEKKIDQVEVIFSNQNEGPDSVEVKITHFPDWKEFVLIDSITHQTALLQFELPKPTMTNLKINENHYKIYLEPGFNVHINRYPDSINFTGDGSVLNNYIYRVKSILKKEIDNGLKSLDVNDFVTKLDSLHLYLDKYEQSYMDILSDKELYLIRGIADLELALLKEEYSFYYHSSMLMDQYYALREGRIVEDFEKPQTLKFTSENLLSDTIFLSLRDMDYKGLLLFYLMEEVHNPLFNAKNLDKPKTKLALKTNIKIKNSGYPEMIKEHLLAEDIHLWLGSPGLTSEVDSIFIDFKNHYQNSNYIKNLEEQYNTMAFVSLDERKTTVVNDNAQELAGLKNQKAFDLIGVSSNGSKIQLSNYNGKIVYIDFWATWCGPCREELPYSKKLASELRGKNDVVFLYVSIDEKLAPWKRLIEKEGDMDGVHLIVQNDQLDTLKSTYLLTTIPRYIIIDKVGNIINPNAPRPSSGLTKELLLKLLVN